MLTRREFLIGAGAGVAGAAAEKAAEVVGGGVGGVVALLKRVRVRRSGATPTNTLEPKGTPIPTVSPTETPTDTPTPRPTLESTFTPTPEQEQSVAWPETAIDLYRSIYQPSNCEQGDQWCQDLTPKEIKAYDANGNELGWNEPGAVVYKVSREGHDVPGKGHQVARFKMINPFKVMIFGWMDNPDERRRLGLTKEEIKKINRDLAERGQDLLGEGAVGAGIPGGYEGEVNGFTFYKSMLERGSALSVLENQTVSQRTQ